MSYKSSTVISITNRTGGNAIITLSHQHSNEPAHVSIPVRVGPGGTVHNILTAHFDTGFLCSGTDYWWIGIEVLDGPNAGRYESDGTAENPVKECTLRSDDKVAALPFVVSTDAFVMTLLSGSCTTPMKRVEDTVLATSGYAGKMPAFVF